MLKTIETIDFNKIRQDFPALTGTNRGKPLVFLDSGASAQKPQVVIDSMRNFYMHDYANIHRGIYELSARATDLFENSRTIVKNFINAKLEEEIIFVRGTTEAINLVAQSYGRSTLKAGDEIILSVMEHHANIVPWYLLKEQIGVELKVVPINDRGELDIDAYKKLFSPRTKFVALTHVSNVLGTINPVKELAAIAHSHEVPILIDGAQGASHLPVDVQAMDCDFYTFSGHKNYGPTGIGVLYGKKAILEKMPPYHGGGSMIQTVSFEKITFAPLPNKFEAGTPDFVAAVGLATALHYLQTIGMENIAKRDAELLAYTQPQLQKIPGLRVIGEAKEKVGVISFVVNNVHPHDLGTVLDSEGIAVRAGHHCAMPLMERFSVPATLRASFGVYSNEQDADALIAGLHLAQRLFK